jgi:hypothetical protein
MAVCCALELESYYIHNLFARLGNVIHDGLQEAAFRKCGPSPEPSRVASSASKLQVG